MRQNADGTVTYFPLDGDRCEVSVGWYCEMTTCRGNLMAMVFRDSPADPWKLVVRTRLYMDNQAQSSIDPRNGYAILAPDNSEEERVKIVAKGDMVFDTLKRINAGRIWRLERTGPANDFLEEWGKLPFVNMKIATPEEVANMGLGRRG